MYVPILKCMVPNTKDTAGKNSTNAKRMDQSSRFIYLLPPAGVTGAVLALPDPGLTPPALLVLPRVVESLLSSELELQESKTINPAPIDALIKRGNWIKVCAHIHLQVTFCHFFCHSILAFWFIKFSRCIFNLAELNQTEIMSCFIKYSSRITVLFKNELAETGNIETFNLVFVAQKILTTTRQKGARPRSVRTNPRVSPDS